MQRRLHKYDQSWGHITMYDWPVACADLQSELESVSSKLSEVTAAKNTLAQAATCFQSEKAICQTSTETYSKVVIESAKELGKLHQQIEQLEADIAEKDLEMVRAHCRCSVAARLSRAV